VQNIPVVVAIAKISPHRSRDRNSMNCDEIRDGKFSFPCI
jgi:hypothetical protein